MLDFFFKINQCNETNIHGSYNCVLYKVFLNVFRWLTAPVNTKIFRVVCLQQSCEPCILKYSTILVPANPFGQPTLSGPMGVADSNGYGIKYGTKLAPANPIGRPTLSGPMGRAGRASPK